LIGIAGSADGTSVDATVAAGGQVSAGPYVVRNQGARVMTEPDEPVQRVAAPVTVLRGERVVAELVPEVRLYRERGERLEETALWSSPWADVQVAVRDAGDDGRALLQVHVRPLLAWVWWGGLLLVAGGAWSSVTRMRRAREPVSEDRPTVPVPTAR
jgi:cytochrome c-type biogenesis protein CcmF